MVELIELMFLEQWIVVVLIAMMSIIIIVKANESFHSLLVYGKNQINDNEKNHVADHQNIFASISSVFRRYTVPKAWFKHYYIYFVGLLIINRIILLNIEIQAWPRLNDYVKQWHYKWCDQEPLTTTNYIHLSIINRLLLIHGSRRLYENVYVTKFSNNTINILHYIFGIMHYTITAVIPFLGILPYYMENQVVPYRMSELTTMDYFTLAVFGFYLIDQYQNHGHLAHLKKYTIPKFRFFQICSSAHYFDEIIIYAAVYIFLISCEHLYWLKLSFTLLLMMVILNLSISAGETHKYYHTKFKQQFKTPYRIIPNVY